MEYEVRYYFNSEKRADLDNKLKSINSLKKGKRTYEKTIQFDHSNEEFSFYSEEVDGRFRIRISKNEDNCSCKISWKRRLIDTISTDVNKEEEVEVKVNYEDYENLLFLISDVLKMKKIESYERYRTIYYNEEIEISIDEYPFGIALEIENKSDNNAEEIVKKWVDVLGFDIKDCYRLSWDDKYTELCRNQNIEIFKDVTFDKVMPKVMD